MASAPSARSAAALERARSSSGSRAALDRARSAALGRSSQQLGAAGGRGTAARESGSARALQPPPQPQQRQPGRKAEAEAEPRRDRCCGVDPWFGMMTCVCVSALCAILDVVFLSLVGVEAFLVVFAIGAVAGIPGLEAEYVFLYPKQRSRGHVLRCSPL